MKKTTFTTYDIVRIMMFISIICGAGAQGNAQSLIQNRGEQMPMPQRSADVPEDEEDVYFILSGEADRAIAEGDYETAKQRIIEALSIDRDNPSNVLLLSNLGMVYSYLDDDALALEALDEAHRRAPAMTTVLNNRAMVYLHMGQDLKAYKDFESVIDLDSINTTARYYRGIISLYLGDIATAQSDFAVLSDIDPDSEQTDTAMATLYQQTGKYLDAANHYKRLIERDPSPEYYGALAECYLELGELSEAASTIAEGLVKYTTDPDLYYYRAWLNRDSYRNADARADAQRAKRLGADAAKVDALFNNRDKH